MRATSSRWVRWALLALMALTGGRAACAVRKGSTTRRSARTNASTSSTSQRRPRDSRRRARWAEASRGLASGRTARRSSATASGRFSSFSSSTAFRSPFPSLPLRSSASSWRDGKTRITTDFAYLEISNRIQARYTHEFPDDLSPILPGTGGCRRFEGLVPHPSCKVQARGVVLDSTRSGARRRGHHAEAVL